MNTPWWQRWPWRPRGGSLQRLLLVGLLVPLWALVALVATVQVVQQVRHNAAAQDAVLHRALTTWPTVLQPQAGASAMEQAPAVWFRESSLDGERLAGSADLPRVPPSEAVQGQGSVHFYLAHLITAVLFFYRGHSLDDAMNALQKIPFFFQIPGEGYSLEIVYLIWILLIAGLYPLCKWYDSYKTAHKEKWWLSYL